MELRTYTGLWKVERRLYKFYDINLPYPVSTKQIGIFILVTIPWIFIMSLFHIPFAPPFGHILWVLPPLGFTWYANKPVAEGKTLIEYGASQIGFFLSQKKFAALSPVPNKPQRVRIAGSAWSSDITEDSQDD